MFGNRAPAAKNVNGQVHFMGAVSTGGSDNFAFTLPPALRPSVTEWIPIGLCNAAKGRMRILSTGDITIDSESGFANAGCFTSLEGASFVLSANSGTAPTLATGWTNGSFNSGPVRVRNDNGIARFSGATSLGTGATVMTLPAQFRPATNVWLYVDFVGAGRGRVLVSPNGTVSVDPATASTLSAAESFLSLEGAEFGI